MTMVWITALGVAPVLLALAGCLVPNNAYLMELNRSGKWRQAERVGLEMLAHRSSFTHSQLCETYFHVIYAQTRSGKKDQAARLVSEYDTFFRQGAVDPQLAWLGREMAKLRDELGLLNEVPHLLVSAMMENGKGNYLRARERCDALLAMEEATPAQQATAHFVAAVCSIRLREAGPAETHLRAFDSLKYALPPDHQALAEEPFARQGLAELRGPRR